MTPKVYTNNNFGSATNLLQSEINTSPQSNPFLVDSRHLLTSLEVNFIRFQNN